MWYLLETKIVGPHQETVKTYILTRQKSPWKCWQKLEDMGYTFEKLLINKSYSSFDNNVWAITPKYEPNKMFHIGFGRKERDFCYI